jgi:hypothetical protein
MEILLILIVISGGIGALIGSSKDRAGAGFLWGACLGVIGWIVIAVAPDQRRKCPKCGTVIGQYPICRSCGQNVGSV